MPAQDGIGRHQCGDLCEQPPTKPTAQDRQASAVTVIEAQALPGEPGLQDAILLPQECDDVGLLTMQPATQPAISNWNKSTPAVYAMAAIHLWDTTRSRPRW
jgi:hypothetical protein